MVDSGKDSRISKEIEHACWSLRQLGCLLFEMAVMRTHLERESKLMYFDSRVNPVKVLLQNAVKKLKGKRKSSTNVQILHLAIGQHSLPLAQFL